MRIARVRGSVWRAVLGAGLLALGATARASGEETSSAAAGARIYAKYCETCHGEELQNNSGVVFDLRRLRADEYERFVASVMNGKRAMPSWSGVLDQSQLDALWSYIRANAYP